MATTSRKYHCPLCRHALTKGEYERVVGIEQGRERDHVAERERFHAALEREREKNRKEQKAIAAERLRLAQQKKNLKNEAKALATREAQRKVAQERAKDERTIKRQESAIQKLAKENEHLKKGRDQGDVGRAWDGEMRDFIAAVFEPLGDVVTTTPRSRNGDVLHVMNHCDDEMCKIIVENKSGPMVTPEFIRQTSRAKRHHQARYALLVSNGHRRGFEGGMKSEGDVILVKPAALMALLGVIRDVHVELARSKATAKLIDHVAQRLVAYVTGADFRAPLDAILKAAADLELNLTKEKEQMGRSWTLRSEVHGRISVDASAIKKAVHAILESRALEQRNIVPMRRLGRAS